MVLRLTVLSAVLLLGACQGSQPALTVDLRTDYVAVAEFLTVETEVFEDTTVTGEGDRREADAGLDDDFTTGVRVAEYHGLKRGSYLVRVRLLDAFGLPVGQRSVRVSLRDSYGLTVMITRDCGGILCPLPEGDPLRTECLGGRCVEPECSPDTPERCAEPECTSGADCPRTVTCAPARCVEGSCLYALDHVACGLGFYCHPDRGCEPLGLGPDAGADGGLDAGDDGGAPDDSGPPPADGGPPPTDSGPPPPTDSGPPPMDSGPPPMDSGPPPCPGECTAGSTGTDREGCGDCGTHTRTRTCGSDCRWGAWGGWGSCTGEGRCSPGARATFPCGTCGSWTCTCQPDCNTWSSCGSCSGDVWCTEFDGDRVCPGSTGLRTCPTDPMGVQRCTCSSGGSWTSCIPGCII